MNDKTPRYVPVCSTSDIPNGSHKSYEVEGVSILLSNLNNQFYAVRNRCTHLDYPLEGGRQMGYQLMCRQHGARFDLRTGRALTGPAVYGLKTYDVRLTGNMVEIEAPDPEDHGQGGLFGRAFKAARRPC